MWVRPKRSRRPAPPRRPPRRRLIVKRPPGLRQVLTDAGVTSHPAPRGRDEVWELFSFSPLPLPKGRVVVHRRILNALSSYPPGSLMWSAGQKTGAQRRGRARGRSYSFSLSKEFARVTPNPRLRPAHDTNAHMVNFDHFPEISNGDTFTPRCAAAALSRVFS